jgi:hypothetical protein
VVVLDLLEVQVLLVAPVQVVLVEQEEHQDLQAHLVQAVLQVVQDLLVVQVRVDMMVLTFNHINGQVILQIQIRGQDF